MERYSATQMLAKRATKRKKLMSPWNSIEKCEIASNGSLSHCRCGHPDCDIYCIYMCAMKGHFALGHTMYCADEKVSKRKQTAEDQQAPQREDKSVKKPKKKGDMQLQQEEGTPTNSARIQTVARSELLEGHIRCSISRRAMVVITASVTSWRSCMQTPIYTADDGGFTPFLNACYRGDLAIVRLLHSHHACRCDTQGCLRWAHSRICGVYQV